MVIADSVRESSGCVLVHCLAGISRSPTLVIAYVMRHLGMTTDQAYRYGKLLLFFSLTQPNSAVYSLLNLRPQHLALFECTKREPEVWFTGCTGRQANLVISGLMPLSTFEETAFHGTVLDLVILWCLIGRWRHENVIKTQVYTEEDWVWCSKSFCAFADDSSAFILYKKYTM